ncbi:glutathione S-transferase [Rhodanobacter sp. K2T2]|uniref:glutathione S-transferase n=1 Tax=Rhodanobacter sp. K2T2 TaxID=2723085 RepID=UPI0015C9EED1|nr:glutathione S-transferase [Rhodanobacter sp. K2T2]NYE29962.1 glutathione S-transferase [Rhodanobacter sp. K2T2]
MRYQLYYWTGIQGRGEFVRLALEDAGADYVDVAREKGDEAIMPFLQGKQSGALPFAPPFLKDGRAVIAQVANILSHLGPKLKLVPASASAQHHASQLQLTIADLVTEVHDTHHPIASSLYYDDQRDEAKPRAEDFRQNRLPKFLGYFENVLERGNGRHALTAHSYVDLSLFQIMSGLDYAFPRAMKKMQRKLPKLRALNERVSERPRIAAYLASPRRLAFNENGIFRHYPELDDAR